MFKLTYWFYVLALATLTLEAQAYIGPGLGAGTIGVILGLLVSILVAIFAIFWYPVKRLLKKRRKKTGENTTPLDIMSDSAED